MKDRLERDLKAALPFGCVAAFLLGMGLAVVVFLGSILGDCIGPCPDRSSQILEGWLLILPIALAFGALVLALSIALDWLLRYFLPRPARLLALLIIVLAIVWISFSPANDLLFDWQSPQI